MAKDNFLPEVGVHWQVAPGHELFASYAENMAMFQGGFKLGPQSVSQAVWDAQGKHAEARDLEELRSRLPLCERPAAGFAGRPIT